MDDSIPVKNPLRFCRPSSPWTTFPEDCFLVIAEVYRQVKVLSNARAFHKHTSLPLTKFSNPGEIMYRMALTLASTIVMVGCASTAGTFFNRPVVEDSIKDAATTVSLAADRRTVVVITEGPNRTKFCAEPPPDTATGLKAELEASLEAKAKSEKLQAEAEGKFVFNDKFQTTVTVMADRTASLDAFRTGVYALCQYHLNGAIVQADIGPLFEKLINAFAASVKSPEK